jgi:uncharacterized protein YdaU (DUF1376 family)
MSLPYYKRFPRDFLDGTIGLCLETKGAYAIVLDLIYMRDGRLADDARYIAGQLGCSVRKWTAIRKELLAAGKIQCANGIISNFRADYLTEESRKYQDNQREIAGLPRKNNTLRQPKPSQSESEPELKKEKVTPSPKKGSRLPPDWKPSEADLNFTVSQNMTAEETKHEADQFRDFWISKPGAGGCKLDWSATWRTWCRNRRGAGQARKPISSGDRSKPTGMAGILAERRRQASIQDDVSAGGWVLSPDDGLSGVWINPGEPGGGAASGSVGHDTAPAGQVRGMDRGPSRGNGSPW